MIAMTCDILNNISLNEYNSRIFLADMSATLDPPVNVLIYSTIDQSNTLMVAHDPARPMATADIVNMR